MLFRKTVRGPGIAASCRGVVKDDRAQALTEFVLIIPVILLIFFAIIEYFQIVQISQMGNYAAYCAARVYAVRGSWDSNAVDRAKSAACLAYAPVTFPRVTTHAANFANMAHDFMEALPGVLDDAAGLMVGYLSAKYDNLGWWWGGGVDIRKGGDPEQVTVDIRYSYYNAWMAVPLGAVWRLTGGEKEMSSDLYQLSEGLGNRAWMSLAKVVCVNVRSRCAMGYEDWSGVVRKKKSASSEAATDPALAEREAKVNEARDEYNEASKKTQKEQAEYAEAKQAYQQAKAEWEALCADPSASDDAKDAAWDKMKEAEQKMYDEKDDYDDALAEQEQKKNKLEQVSGADL